MHIRRLDQHSLEMAESMAMRRMMCLRAWTALHVSD